jgi:hypothetical protein
MRQKVVAIVDIRYRDRLFFCPKEACMKDCIVWCRLSPALSEKLDRLCQQTGRSRSEVLRAITAAATLESLPAAWRGEEAARLLEIER